MLYYSIDFRVIGKGYFIKQRGLIRLLLIYKYIQVYLKLLVLAFYLTIYLWVKCGTEFTLNAEMVVYSTLVLAYKYTTFIKDDIIFNRGSIFTSEYWSTIYYHLHVLRKLSTAFHPQIDGQTEYQNQELKAYLYIFTNWEQSNQVSLLNKVAFTYNSKVYAITKYSPIKLAYG